MFILILSSMLMFGVSVSAQSWRSHSAGISGALSNALVGSLIPGVHIVRTVNGALRPMPRPYSYANWPVHELLDLRRNEARGEPHDQYMMRLRRVAAGSNAMLNRVPVRDDGTVPPRPTWRGGPMGPEARAPYHRAQREWDRKYGGKK
jgi:hypothetical protein